MRMTHAHRPSKGAWCRRTAGASGGRLKHEALERRVREAVGRPLVLGNGSEAPVEADGGLIPVEHRPLEPRAASLEGCTGDPRQQPLADAAPARFGPHK